MHPLILKFQTQILSTRKKANKLKYNFFCITFLFQHGQKSKIVIVRENVRIQINQYGKYKVVKYIHRSTKILDIELKTIL